MCKQSAEEQKKQIDLLLEEWKQNVALYIDQDQRGFTRINWFWALIAGLLIIFQYLPNSLTKAIMAAMALFITVITCMMSRRAHSYINLREVQLRLIEDKIKKLTDCIDSNTLTTFSRENAVYGKKPKPNQNEKILEFDEKTMTQLGLKKKCSLGHLKWLNMMFITLIFLWLGILVASFTDWFLKPPATSNMDNYKTVECGYRGIIYENESDDMVSITIHTINNCSVYYSFIRLVDQQNATVSDDIEIPSKSGKSIAFSIPQGYKIYLCLGEKEPSIKDRLLNGEKTGLSYAIDYNKP